MITFLSFLKKWKWALILVVVVGGAIYYFSNAPQVSPFETTEVKIGRVVQEVSVTGRVESERDVDLSFERGGRVVAVAVEVGTPVDKGDTLIRLDGSELSTLRAQAVANLEYEEAKLDELYSGARPEDISISEARVESATQAVYDSERSLLATLVDAFTKADDAVRNNADQLFTNPRTSNPLVNFPMTDQKTKSELEFGRLDMEKILKDWSENTMIAPSDAPEYATVVEGYLDSVKLFTEKLGYAVNNVLPNTATAQTTIESWKAAVSSARTSVNAASQAVVSADSAYRSTMSALLVARNELALKRAGATPEAIAAQQARIASGKATLSNYDAQIGKLSIIAPFSGVVTRQDAKLGKNVSANAPLVSLMSNGAFKVEANIPEVDVAKVKIADLADVTLDAYGSDTIFPASLVAIDPAATIIEGVPTYKVTLRFAGPDERIRAGMTANITIKTATKEGVLLIPLRAVTTREGKKYARILSEGVAKEMEVNLGLRGSDGQVEVLSGLESGQSVITFEKTQ